MTFTEEVWLLLIGVGIGLVSSIVGAVVQHFLSLRTEKIKAEREREKKVKGLLVPSPPEGSVAYREKRLIETE
jgi:hypothetical protein